MPLRVRCRCGQEVTLRFNEWVYFVVGLLALGVVINAGALVLIYSRLGDLTSAVLVPRAPAEFGVGLETDSGETAVSRRAREGVAVPGVRESSSPAPAVDPPEKGVESGRELEETAPSSPAAAIGPSDPPGEVSADPPLDRATSISDLVEKLRRESEPRADAPAARVEDARGAESQTDTETVVEADSGPVTRTLAEGATRLERLILLESISDHPELLGALLQDPDERIRARVLGRLSAWVRRAAGDELETLRNGLRPWLPPVRPWLEDAPRGRELLSKLETTGSGASEAPDWESASRAATDLLASLNGYESLKRSLAASAEEGTDVVLAVDVTESMEMPIRTLQSVAPWLLRSLLWVIPDLRVGIVFYRDRVESVAPFTASAAELIEALSRERAEGGGDVPEGVHEAIEGALQLGRFAWRPKARKTIIVVGDASPPHAELRALLSLVREAHRERGYRIHAVSVQPESGRKAVPFFDELAGAGHGRAVTAGVVELPRVLLELLFPSDAGELVRRTLPALREIGS